MLYPPTNSPILIFSTFDTHSVRIENSKTPVRAKALIINAFALTGRIVFGGFLPQGVALGYVLLPPSGRAA